MAASQTPLMILMLVAGICIPVMAAVNAYLGSKLGNPLLAVAILCLVASVASVAACILLIGFAPASTDPVWPRNPLYYAAGILFILYIASITYSAPRIGLSTAIMLVIFGQLISASLIDQFGWFGAPISPLTPQRLIGLALVGMGVVLAKAEP